MKPTRANSPISLRRKIAIGIAAIIFCIVIYFGYVGYKIIYTVQHIPEAYAAWDTGTLLVEYMKSHNDKWPSSWEDLLTVMGNNPENKIMFRGAAAGDTNYAFSLQKKVAIDWKFKPTQADFGSPITRLDGTKFPVVWTGAEPNEMVREYLKSSMNTNPASSH